MDNFRQGKETKRTVSTLFIGLDYQALNTIEGDRFAQLIRNGYDINNKTVILVISI